MNLFRRSVPVVAALGLVATGLLAAPGVAAPTHPRVPGAVDRASAVTPTCSTMVGGVLPSGKLVRRQIKNVKLISEKKTATALPYPVESVYSMFTTPQEAGADQYVDHLIIHTPGLPAKQVDLTDKAAAPTLTTKIVHRLRPTPKARTWANSGRFYTYAITPNGNLTRFSRLTDGTHYWIGNPKTVKTGQSSIRSMSLMFSAELGGVRKDILYVTTKGGALKQIQVPWPTPGKPKITTLKSTGFAAVTSLSLSWCNNSGTIGSLIAIERGNNRARWWTLAGQFSPRPANLTRHPLVAPGAEWRLKASY